MSPFRLPALVLPLAAGLFAASGTPLPGARAEDPPAKTPVASFFHGKVASFEGRRITLKYDFSDSAQSSDWMPTFPFVRPTVNGGWRVEGGALRGDGNAGYRMRAVFDGDLRIDATLSSEDAKNFGLMVLDEDRTVFNLCSLADTAFAMLDRKPPLMHQLTTFLPAGEGPGGSTEWRYIETGYEPRIGSKPVDVSVRKKGAMNEFRFAGTGRLSGADKEVKVGPRIVPGFYTLGSRVVVSKVTVSGVLDVRWLRDNNIQFEDRVPADGEPPIAGPAPPPDPDPAGDAPAPAPAAAGGDWITHYAALASEGNTKEQRETASDALAATKERRALRPLIDILYRDEDETGRVLAWKAFKGICGKDPGFRPESSKDARLKAMPRVWEYWYTVRDQLEKEDRKKEK